MDIFALVPQFGNLVGTVLAFIVALSVIVAIHEYGHYIVGRWSGIHAEVFSLGFGPVIWSRVDRRGTRWQVAALPFGGYVKFLGDADAASGKDSAAMEEIAEMTPEQLRHTMHGAPLWARAATVAAGPVFNFILSILVFGAVILARGEVTQPLTVGEMRPLPPLVQELRPGDQVLAIGGVPVPDWSDAEGFEAFDKAIPMQPVLDYVIRRDGQETQVKAPYPYPPLVIQLAPQSSALKTDIKAGDVVLTVDGTPIFAFQQLKDRVEASNGEPLDLQVWRAGEILEFELAPRRTDEPQPDGGFITNWRLGIAGGLMFDPAREATGPGTALWGGVVQTGAVIRGSISGLYHMVTGAISSCNMSGPLGIAQVSGQMASQGATSFIWFIAVLSTAVGLLNLFPIPVLDGGHLVFYGYEAVVGKPPNEKVLSVLMTIGLTLILAVMLFALSNDLFCP